MYLFINTIIHDKCICITISKLCNITDGVVLLPFVANLKDVLTILCVMSCIVYNLFYIFIDILYYIAY